MDAALLRKGGKAREIPFRGDLQDLISAISTPRVFGTRPSIRRCFKAALKKQRRLSGKAIHVNDICRMMKRRLKDIGLLLLYSPHYFRVTTIRDLLEPKPSRSEDVQRLAGHSDPRATSLYDRRKRKITRKIVERISM